MNFNKNYIRAVLPILLIVVIIILIVIKNIDSRIGNRGFYISYPFHNALFPPEFPSFTVKWVDTCSMATKWQVSLATGNYKIIAEVTEQLYKPLEYQWDSLKLIANEDEITIEIKRISNNLPKALAKVKIQVSADEVGAPILYRETPLPFVFAEKHLDSLSYRLLNVGSKKSPHYVIRKFMVCGNCHSFSNDGKYLGLDFDAAQRDKGGYFIDKIRDTMVYDTSNYLSWTKLQNRPTFGTFSKISPDGRYVVTTIKDRVVSRNFGFSNEEIKYSQLFFPVNGVLAIYDTQTRKLWELPGADSEDFVQTNAIWTPDGKEIIFARGKALPRSENIEDLKVDDEFIVDEFVERKREFKYDIYKIPFNEGKGGVAEPLKGASDNGKSNYFPAISPDGKWIVYCQAQNFMLLMPDSKLFIIPAQGGKARELESNFKDMNSWHAWSPNSKWLVFCSKAYGPYTDMFLTHFDENGNESVPVLIENSRVKSRAANYPEFLNVKADYTFNMVYNYVNLDNIHRALIAKDTLLARDMLEKFIKQGQIKMYSEYMDLSDICKALNMSSEAEQYLAFAKKLKESEK